MAIKIYNTLGKEKQEFKPLKKGLVSFYYCGPTVYKDQHIGGLRGNLMADLIHRSLMYLGYKVDFVSNYTDVGHLVSDEDSGEDKLNKQALLEKKTPKEIADKTIKNYERDSKDLNILFPTVRCRATDYIPEMIDMIQVLIDKGFAYQTDLAIYFDVSKAKNYTALSGQNLEELKSGAGTGDVSDTQKKNPYDFALWFFKKGVHEKALQTWNSPWGQGFPGWHIECSAMAKKNLGDTIDIHMGGIEHIPTHHTNEIAQSESANGVKFSNYWIHNGHLLMNNTKISKSLGNVVFVKDLKEKGFNPLALRYFFLQAHYRSSQNFTWEALESAKNGLNNLSKQISSLGENIGEINKDFKNKFVEKLEDDFNIPQALVVLYDVLKSDIENKDKLATALDFDRVFGLKLNDLIETKSFFAKVKEKFFNKEKNIPKEIKILTQEREIARKNKNYQRADDIRDEIEKKGFEIKDTENGTKIFKK